MAVWPWFLRHERRYGGAAGLLARYARNPEQGALLFVSVPDEEAFSAGMRGALPFLQELREQYHLEYKLLINCEPNRREGIPTGCQLRQRGQIIAGGAGPGQGGTDWQLRPGSEPVAVLAELAAATEGDPEFVEDCGGEQTVPPVWYHLRDLKAGYDYSLPAQAAGYCNVLTFTRSAVRGAGVFCDSGPSGGTGSPGQTSQQLAASMAAAGSAAADSETAGE
jgi:arginine utilization protein RocB